MTEQLLQCVDYEDELDLLAISTVAADDHSVASIQLHDNQTGKLVKEMALEESWVEVRNRTDCVCQAKIKRCIINAQKSHYPPGNLHASHF